MDIMNIKDRLQDALKKVEGFGEIRFGRREVFSLRLRNGIPETVNPIIDIGGSVEVLIPKHGWGFATFNKIEDIEPAVQDAIDASRAIIPDEPIELVEVEPVSTEVKDELDDDFHNHSIQEKYDLLVGYDSRIEGKDERIVERSLAYSEEFSDSFLLTTEGTDIFRSRSDAVIRCAVRARKGDLVQSAHKSYATRRSFGEIVNRNEMIDKVVQTALGLVESETVKGGIYTVVLNPDLAGVFIHEAFGHLSEADHIEENPQAQEMMKIGRKFGPEFLNVFDDGSVLPAIRGTIVYDDEGVRAEKTYLIKEGVLVGRLHSRATAAKLGEKTTGNARAQSSQHFPIVRMTNTAIEKGPHPAKNIFDGIKLGVYAIDAYGGQTQLENFSFSAGYAYMIRDGKIAEMVRDVVLQGNLFQTLANIEQVGDDFVWDSSGGYCGKGGQRVPTSEGSPHIRIKNVMIAGK
ncbi:TldD/PmbA family protein [bacterium]|nr:TldD/PmbA family protein [bacterium]